VPYQLRVRRPSSEFVPPEGGSHTPLSDAIDRLVGLGALDIEPTPDGGLAALMPDSATPERVACALGVDDLAVSPAIGRDADSVWVLRPRPVRAGRVRLIPATSDAEPGAVRLIDSPAFGTGLHPTTALCLEALDEIVAADPPDRLLDVGTGSGVLALAALQLGVSRVTAIDVDADALRVASENARLNAMSGRLELVLGDAGAVTGTWPLVLANVLAAPLIDMAPTLVRRVGHHGRVILSGIPASVEADVAREYRRLGMRHVQTRTRGGWIAMRLQASW